MDGASSGSGDNSDLNSMEHRKQKATDGSNVGPELLSKFAAVKIKVTK